MELFEDNWNAYEFVYMGLFELNVSGVIVYPHKPLYVPKKLVADFIGSVPDSERDNFIYQKILITSL